MLLSGLRARGTRRRHGVAENLFPTFEAAVPATVAVDAEKLRRMVVNLVDNAVKYSPDGGLVEVAAQTADGRLRITVEDGGIGIPAEDRERVFEKFRRLDPHMRRGIGGTGLGLYICRELVRQMGGEIWVTGNEWRGSTFVFELPLAEQPQRAGENRPDRDRSNRRRVRGNRC